MGFFTNIKDEIEKKRQAMNLGLGSTNTATQAASPRIAGGLFSIAQKNRQPDTPYNYQTKSQDQWSAVDYAAYGRISGDSSVFDALNTLTDQRGSQFWNPYRGKRAVLPDGCEDFFSQRFGYNGRFDQQFCDDYNALYGNDVSLSRTLGVSTPTKKSSPQEWAGWYVTQVQDNLLENNELDSQWDEARRRYNDYYDQYQKINGRAPSLEEFERAVDLSKYSKINAINESLRYGTKLQILPSGTYYSPDIISGLYQAKQNGEDINVDRDYFEDAVQYAMNPVQHTQANQKYLWSNDNLSEISQEDRDAYLSQLIAKGNYEEAEAFKYACWAAQPHDDNISSEPSVLDAAYGYYHDESWFSRVHKELGDEYDARLNYDGTMNNPGKSGDYMDQACWSLYNTEKTREKTREVEDAYKDVIAAIQNHADKHLKDYTADQFEDFKSDILMKLDLENNSTLKPYLKDGYDPSKYCRDLHFNEDTISAAIKHAWNGERLSSGVDYAAQADDGFSLPQVPETPAELPLFYEEQQRREGEQRMVERNNAEEAVTEAVASLADSGALISKGAIPASNSTFDRMLDFADAGVDLMGKLWQDVFGAKHSEKLGADFTPAEAAAADPVLAQLDTRDMPDTLTTDDIARIVEAKVMSKVQDDSICLADGIINYALPGATHLHEIMLGRSASDIVKEFNPLTYRNIYLDRVNAGLGENAAAKVAAYAATDINQAVKSIGSRFEGDDMLTNASQRLLNNIAQEEGAKDSYDIYMAINDDITSSPAIPNAQKANDVMQKLLPGMLLGSSEAATPGFRAETNRLTHDLATGAITAEDIIEGLDELSIPKEYYDQYWYKGETNAISERAEAYLRKGYHPSGIVQVNGTMYDLDEYDEAVIEGKALLRKASGFWGTDRAFDDMSDTLKDMIGYDDLIDAVKAAHPEDEWQIYIDDTVHNAVEALVEPDQVIHTTPQMSNHDDFLLQNLYKITSSKTQEEIDSNLLNTGMSGLEKWSLTKDATGIAAAALAFLGNEQSQTGELIDLFYEYGPFLATSEANALVDAFMTGKATLSEVKGLVYRRVQSTSREEVNALHNLDVLTDSYTHIQEGLDKLRDMNGNTGAAINLAGRMVNGEEYYDVLAEHQDILNSADGNLILDQLQLKGVLDDTELISRISGILDKYDLGNTKQKAFTPEQLSNMESCVKLYIQNGAHGYTWAHMDPDNMKNWLDIDLEGTGFKNAAELLSYLYPDWAKAYDMNPGYELGAVETVGKGIGSGIRSVLKIPALANNFCREVAQWLTGKYYSLQTGNDSSVLHQYINAQRKTSEPGFFDRQYQEFKRQDEHAAVMRQNIATKGQAFTEQAVSEATRNMLTSSIGSMIGNAFVASRAVGMTGTTEALDSLVTAQSALQTSAQFITRTPFATGVFLNEFDKQIEDGASVGKALARGILDAGIELLTEDLPTEKFHIMPIGGSTIRERAANGISSLGSAALQWGINGVNSMISEVAEEEASEFLGRIVDTAESLLKGESFTDSLKGAFAGYDQAAKDIALSTMATTAIFAALDLHGSTYDYMMDSLSSGKPANVDRLMTSVQADIIASKDEQSQKKTVDQKVYPNRAAVRPGMTGAAYDPATMVPYFGKKNISATENEAHSAYDPATQVPYFGKKVEAQNVVSIEGNAAKQEPANVEAVQGTEAAPVTKTEQAESRLREAVMAHMRESTEETAQAIGNAAGQMLSAIAEDRAESEQQATETQEASETPQEPQEAVTEQPDENVQEQLEEQPGMTVELSENAQRVRDYVAHAEDALDNAVIDTGAQMDAEKAVAEDSGLKAREESIQKMQGEIQEVEQNIAGLRQQAAAIVGRTEQMYRAALDSGLDARSPQAVNVANQLKQQRDATSAQIGKQTQKQSALTRQMQEQQQLLEAAREEALKKAKETSAKDYRDKIAAYREEKAKYDASAQRAINQTRIENQGARLVSTPYTDAEYAANAKKRKQEAADMTGTLMARAERGQMPSPATTEAYTDPGKYTAPLTETARDDEWKEEAARDKVEIEEQQTREAQLLGDYKAGEASRRHTSDIPVSRDIFDYVCQAVRKRYGVVDSRLVYSRTDKGGKAKISGERQYTESGNGTPAYTPGDGYGDTDAYDQLDLEGMQTATGDAAIAKAEARIAQEAARYDASDLMNEDGSLTGTAAQMLMEAGTDPTARYKTNTGEVYEHVTENGQYLIVKRRDANDTQSNEDWERYQGLTTRAQEDGLTGMERGEQMYEAKAKEYADALSEVNETALAVLKAKNALESGSDKDRKEAAKAYQLAEKQLRKAQSIAERRRSELEKIDERNQRNEAFLERYVPVKKKSEPVYYAIDKSRIQENGNPDSIAIKALQQAAEQFAEYRELSNEGFWVLLMDEAGYTARELDAMKAEELPQAYMDFLFNKFMGQESRQAYNGAVAFLRGDQIDKFVKKHGGYADAGIETGGKGFTTFTGRDDYSQDKVYFISERAAHEFLTDAQKKGLGINRTSAQYNAEIDDDLDEYIRERGLGEQDALALRRQLIATREQDEKQREGFYITTEDGRHELGIRKGDRFEAGVNSYLRDENGDYDIGIAKDRLKKELDFLADQGRREETGAVNARGKRIHLDTRYHNIQVTYVDGYGKQVTRTIGEAYKSEDGTTRWFPSYEWIMNNAIGVTCNFYCDIGKGNQQSRVNFKLFPAGTHADIVDFDAQNDEKAPLRSAGELQREVDKIEAYAEKFDKIDSTFGQRFMDAWRGARYNHAVNQYRKALDKATHATPDTFQKAIEDVETARAEMEFFGSGYQYQSEDDANAESPNNPYTSNYEERLALARDTLSTTTAMLDKGEQLDKATLGNRDRAKKRVREYNARIYLRNGARRNVDSSAVSAKEEYDAAVERYDRLTHDAVYADNPQFSAEATALADVIPMLKQRVEAEEAFTSMEDDNSSKKPDPMLRRVAEAIVREKDNGNEQAATTEKETQETANPTTEEDAVQEPSSPALSDEAKLAALKMLASRTSDVDDIRTKAIQDYHDRKMENMSEQEKIDYVAALAREQAKTKGGYAIDPKVDYDQILQNMLQAQAKKERSRQARRLRDIGRKAGTYKTERGINKALDELTDMEKAGYDVAETREALQRNLEAIRNPNQDKIDAVIDSVEDEQDKLNLQLFSEKTTDTALAEATDPLDDLVDTMFTDMSGPRTVNTGFEDTVKDIQRADTDISRPEQQKEYEDALAGRAIAVRGLNEDIDRLSNNISRIVEQREEIHKKMDAIRRKGVTAENNERLDMLYEDYRKAYDSGDARSAKSYRHSLQTEIDLALGDPANPWTSEERDEYDKLQGQYAALGRKLSEKSGDRDSVIAERDSIKKAAEPYKRKLLASKIADDIVNNRAVFGPEQLQTDGSAQTAAIHRQRRQKDNEAAKAYVDDLHTGAIHGKSTIYTNQELARARAKAIDEKQLAENQAIAEELGHEVKDMKTKLAIIDLAKAYIAGDENAYRAQFEKSFDDIMELYPQKEFTPQGARKHARMQERTRKMLTEYIDGLKEQYTVENDGDALYKVLDQQRLIIEAAIERAERVSKNYYSMGADNIASVYMPNHGGHMPAQFYRMDTALIRNAIKKNNPKKPITATIDTFPRLVESYLGKDADAIISQYVQPVRDAESHIAKRREELRSKYDWMRKLDKSTKEAITRAVNDGTDEDIIRRDHPDNADTIIRGINAVRELLDELHPEINSAYVRNGLAELKKRSNYIPHIPAETNPILRAMGIHASFEDISIKDFGKSAEYKPVHEFFRYAYERKEDSLEGCELDPCVILDTYIDSALTQIYQTDNIIRLRDLHDCILENGDYNDQGKLAVGGLSHFAQSLDEYAKMVAGKKVGYVDRAIEAKWGRKFFAWAKALTQIKGQSATGANMNVVAANLEPLTMCIGTNPVQTVRAIFDTIASRITGTDRDVIKQDSFYSTRTSEKKQATTPYQKAVQLLYKPAEASDDLITEIVVRAGYYNACHRLGIDRDGSTDMHKKAWINADNFATKIMASKGRGEKAMMYNTSWGSIVGQFLQESINNLQAMAKDTSQYAGGKAYIGKLSGTVKALAAVLMALLGHSLINQGIGHETVVDPYGAIYKGLKNRGEDESPLATAKNIGESIAEGMNPFNNLLDNDSDIPIIGNIPAVSSMSKTFENIVNAAEKAWNTIDEKMNDNQYSDFEKDWAYELVSAVLNWAPGGVQAKRLLDTGRAADKGYVLSKKGRFKYAYEPTVGNIALSAAFGTDSSIEGRQYVMSGYKTQSDTNTNKILSMIDLGMSAHEAVAKVQNEKKLSEAKSLADKQARRDEDNTEALNEARELREQIPYPDNMIDLAVKDVNDKTIQKGLDMWKETGLETYPTSMAIYSNDEEYGPYMKANNKDVRIDDATIEKMNADYYRNARHIIEDNDDPKTVAKQLSDLQKFIKKKYLGGE